MRQYLSAPKSPFRFSPSSMPQCCDSPSKSLHNHQCNTEQLTNKQHTITIIIYVSVFPCVKMSLFPPKQKPNITLISLVGRQVSVCLHVCLIFTFPLSSVDTCLQTGLRRRSLGLFKSSSSSSGKFSLLFKRYQSLHFFLSQLNALDIRYGFYYISFHSISLHWFISLNIFHSFSWILADPSVNRIAKFHQS